MIHAEPSNNDIDIDRPTLSYFINEIYSKDKDTYEELYKKLAFKDLERV